MQCDGNERRRRERTAGKRLALSMAAAGVYYPSARRVPRPARRITLEQRPLAARRQRAREHALAHLLVHGRELRAPVPVLVPPALDERERLRDERREDVVQRRVRRHGQAVPERRVLVRHQAGLRARQRRARRHDDRGQRGVRVRDDQGGVSVGDGVGAAALGPTWVSNQTIGSTACYGAELTLVEDLFRRCACWMGKLARSAVP